MLFRQAVEFVLEEHAEGTAALPCFYFPARNQQQQGARGAADGLGHCHHRGVGRGGAVHGVRHLPLRVETALRAHRNG